MALVRAPGLISLWILLASVHKTVFATQEIFMCDFEDPRSPLCSFRAELPQKSVTHRDEQWESRRAGIGSRAGDGSDGPTVDRTLDTSQGSYGYTKALNQSGMYFYSFRVIIVSPSLVLSSGRGRLSFSAYLWTGAHAVQKADNLPTLRVRGCGDEISWSLQGRTAAWQNVDFPIKCNKTFELVIEAIHRMPGSSVAVDDIRVISILDLKPHMESSRVTHPTYDYHDITTPSTTAAKDDTINRSVLITLSGPTIGAIIGIILVILLLNILVFIILRIKVKSNKNKKASSRRKSAHQNPNDKGQCPDSACIHMNQRPVLVKGRSFDEDTYTVPDEGFYADDFDDTIESFVEGSSFVDSRKNSRVTIGKPMARSSADANSEISFSRGIAAFRDERKASLAQEAVAPPSAQRHGMVERGEAPVSPTPKRGNGFRKAPPLPGPTSQSNARNEPLPADSNGIGSLSKDLPGVFYNRRRNDSQLPEIPLPLYKRKESLTPEIPVMPVTGRRKESLTPDPHTVSPSPKRKEPMPLPSSKVSPAIGRRKESLPQETPMDVSDMSTLTLVVGGTGNDSVTYDSSVSLSPQPSRRNEPLSPETPTMPLPEIPRSPANSRSPKMTSSPKIHLNGTSISPGYTELTLGRNLDDDEDHFSNRDGTGSDNSKLNPDNLFKDKMFLNASQDETGYLKPSSLAEYAVGPVYESAQCARSKRSTRKLIHEYHDLAVQNGNIAPASPEYELSMINRLVTPPSRSKMSVLWRGESEYEELHI